MQIEERNNLVKLFDTYGNLLSPKQRDVMDKYLNSDYSESELAENSGETRQSVHDAVTKAKQQLFQCEEKCNVVTNSNTCKLLLKKAQNLIERGETAKAAKTIQDIIDLL